jgi:putative transposase
VYNYKNKMAARKTKFIESEYYHIYNRGNSKQQIFHDAQDYERFKKMLFMCNGKKKFKFKELLKVEKNAYEFDRGESIVKVVSYVMMPNHFHLFLTPCGAGGINSTDSNLGNNLSIFMKRLTVSYSKYYNYKYSKIGSLFEGSFKAEHVNNDNYFKYLFSYIHLNPVKLIQKDWKEIGIKDFNATKKFLQEYRHSSFLDYFSTSVPYGGIVDKHAFLSKIPTNTDLSKEIFDWLNFKTIV